jgi:hypothetical protein
MLGGDMEITSGAEAGGADTLRDLLANCLLGERGEEAGEVREVVRGRRRTAGDGCRTSTVSSSGSGPRVEPPEAELTPDMAETLVFSSRFPLEVTKEFWIAA